MGVWYRLWWVWLERCRDGGVLKGVAYGCVVSFVVGVVGKM